MTLLRRRRISSRAVRELRRHVHAQLIEQIHLPTHEALRDGVYAGGASGISLAHRY